MKLRKIFSFHMALAPNKPICVANTLREMI